MRLLVIAGLLATMTLNAATNETVTLGGNTVKLAGHKVSVGDKAPKVTVIDSDLKEVVVGGKTKNTQVILVVPSIDTPVCDAEARYFNEQASKKPNVKIVVVSMDLPFASKRYCAAHNIKNITVTSDFQAKKFGNTYGTLIGTGALKGIEARVIFVIKNGKVSYKQLVPEITNAPDYEAVLKAL